MIFFNLQFAVTEMTKTQNCAALIMHNFFYAALFNTHNRHCTIFILCRIFWRKLFPRKKAAKTVISDNLTKLSNFTMRIDSLVMFNKKAITRIWCCQANSPEPVNI